MTLGTEKIASLGSYDPKNRKQTVAEVAHDVHTRSADCCVILGVDRGRGTALAVEEKTGRKVMFSVQNHRYLQALRQGLKVGVDFDHREVVLPSVCQETNCTIVTISDEQPELDTASLQAGRPKGFGPNR